MSASLPMKTLVLAVFLAIFLAAFSRAQNLNSAKMGKPPLAPGSLINRAPDFATWTIFYSYSDKTKVVSGQAQDQPLRLKAITVTKTKEICCEQATYSNGSKYEIWHVGSLQIQVGPTGIPCIYTANSSNTTSFFTDYTQTDFRDMEWLSKGDYLGVQKINDVEYLVFQGNTSIEFTGLSQATSAVTARVIRQSRLPFQIVADDWTMTYVFGTPPQSMLVLPSAVQKALDERIQVIKTLTTRHSSF